MFLLIYEDGTAVTASAIDQAIVDGCFHGVLSVYRYELERYFEMEPSSATLDNVTWNQVKESHV